MTPEQMVGEIAGAGITHAVWLPDSTLGAWDAALAQSLRLIRVCREGEAWAVAAGLHLGGARPVVLMQCTGLFESGDSLRNALFDYDLPLTAVVGHRSALVEGTGDSAARFTRPILQAWGLCVAPWVESGDFACHHRRCQAAGRPGVLLLPEGRM